MFPAILTFLLKKAFCGVCSLLKIDINVSLSIRKVDTGSNFISLDEVPGKEQFLTTRSSSPNSTASVQLPPLSPSMSNLITV